MTKRHWESAIPGLLALAGLMLASCGGGQATPATPQGSSAAAPASLQAVIDGARKEGKLVLIWGEGAVGGAEGARQLGAGLNKRYGLNLDVQFTPGPAMPDLASKVLQEFLANRPASTDVLIGSEAHFPALIQAKGLEVVDWPSWSENVKNPKLLGTPDGQAVKIASRTPGVTYNATRISGDAVPKNMQDLLKPQYKGRLASTPYAAMFDRLASDEWWGEQRTYDYVTKLSAQASGLIRCGEDQRVASGEFDLFALDCGQDSSLRARAKGAPLSQVVPTDAAALVYWYMGVPKNAAHPNAAKLFIEFLMGRQGQDIMYETSFDDNHLLPGSHLAEPISKLQAQGVTFKEIDIAWVQRNDEQKIDRVRKQLQDILAKK
jgi:iron(III) transport system substrate-binding protein